MSSPCSDRVFVFACLGSVHERQAVPGRGDVVSRGAGVHEWRGSEQPAAGTVASPSRGWRQSICYPKEKRFRSNDRLEAKLSAARAARVG